jgi:hypothetical protein
MSKSLQAHKRKLLQTMIDAISNFALQSDRRSCERSERATTSTASVNVMNASENVFDMMKRLSGEIDNFLEEIGYPIPHVDQDSDSEYSPQISPRSR